MNDKQTETTETEEPADEGKKSFLNLYIAIGGFAVGCILFILSLTAAPKIGGSAGVYFLIASMISELASVSFLNAQKRKAETKLRLIFTILSYVVMAAALGIFIAGMSVGSANN